MPVAVQSWGDKSLKGFLPLRDISTASRRHRYGQQVIPPRKHRPTPPAPPAGLTEGTGMVSESLECTFFCLPAPHPFPSFFPPSLHRQQAGLGAAPTQGAPCGRAEAAAGSPRLSSQPPSSLFPAGWVTSRVAVVCMSLCSCNSSSNLHTLLLATS